MLGIPGSKQGASRGLPKIFYLAPGNLPIKQGLLGLEGIKPLQWELQRFSSKSLASWANPRWLSLRMTSSKEKQKPWEVKEFSVKQGNLNLYFKLRCKVYDSFEILGLFYICIYFLIFHFYVRFFNRKIIYLLHMRSLGL